MKKILIVCVNYNSYKELYDFLDSVDSSAELAKEHCRVKVYVADNSAEKQKVDTTLYSHIDIHVKLFGNLGYLGGAQAIINNIECITDYDYVIISNVDLLIHLDFIPRLTEIDIDMDVAWITPRIYSLSEKRYRSPKRIRYTKAKLKALLYMYRFPVLQKLYVHFFYRMKTVNPPIYYHEIYAGHGSIMVFTRSFFQSYPQINYPIFLYCEELYFAELIRKANKKVQYMPTICVKDIDHVSTSKMKSDFYYSCNYKAVSYILQTFYNNE